MKLKYLILLLATFTLTLTGCKKETTQSSSITSSITDQQAPTIEGVLSEATIALGESWNALANVSASDEVDGDLTAKIEISSIPAMVNVDGYFTPEERGEYYVTYKVTNSREVTTEAYTTLTVTAPELVESKYLDFTLEQKTLFNYHDWDLEMRMPALADFMETKDALLINIQKHGTEFDIALSKIGFSLNAAVDYALKLALAEPNLTLSLAVSDAIEETEVFPFVYDSETALYVADFSLLSMFEDATLRIGLSGLENESIETITLQSITLLEMVSEGEGVLLLNDNFNELLGWDYNAFDGASANISHVDNSLEFNMTYAANNNPWTLNLFQNTGVQLFKNESYRVSVEISSVESQFYELCFEDVTMDWQVRAAFKDGTLEPGANTIDFTFKANMSIDNLYLKLALGRGSTVSNTINLQNVTIYSLADIKDSSDFSPEYSNVAYKMYNEEEGSGSLSSSEETLTYHITSFGNVDWHNKIAFENIDLNPLAAYRFSFTLSSSLNGKLRFTVNRSGEWNPLINEEQLFSAEETTYSFTIDQKLFTETTIDLLFQFGGFSENIAPMDITFHNVTIWELK